GLYQVDGRAVVESVRSVSVTKPVRADRGFHPNSRGRPAHDRADAPAVQKLPAAGREDRLLVACVPTQADQLRPKGSREGDGPRAAILAESRDLSGIAARVQISPPQAASLGDTQASQVQQIHKDGIAPSCFRSKQPPNVLLGQNSFCKPILISRQDQFE